MTSATVILPNGSVRLRKRADRLRLPQKRVLETGSDSCRSKADSRRYERNPLTEKGNFKAENNTAGIPAVRT